MIWSWWWHHLLSSSLPIQHWMRLEVDHNRGMTSRMRVVLDPTLNLSVTSLRGRRWYVGDMAKVIMSRKTDMWRSRMMMLFWQMWLNIWTLRRMTFSMMAYDAKDWQFNSSKIVDNACFCHICYTIEFFCTFSNG